MITIQDHTPNGIAGMHFGGVIYRLSAIIPPNLSYESLRHKVYNEAHLDNYYTKIITMKMVLDQAKQFSMYFIVNNNIQWFKPDTSIETYARVSGAIADLLEDNNFNDKTAAIALMNEPNKFCKVNGKYSNDRYIEYCQRSNNYVKGRFPLILINDEYFINWSVDVKYILSKTVNIPKRIWGVHHLSSLGKTPKWENIRDCKTIANEFGIPIVCDEGGSWWFDYQKPEGHAINIKLLAECNKYDYMGCAVVLVDTNKQTKEGKYPKLGYRVWNNNYTKILNQTNWDKFEEELKKYKKGDNQMPEYNVPDELKVIADKLGNKVGNYSEELPVLTGTGIWQNAIGHKRNDILLKADFDAAAEKILKITGVDISVYYNFDGTWNNNWEDIAKSNPK